ncbi:hypothetical protein EQG41_18220 [Billgrantia azerbaijanica]|nr:hypothetical protein EQG41_18220 [Halomonas azerbaijanica]
MQAIEKKPMPAGIYVFCLMLYAALFAYPVAEGGLANLATFMLWLCAPSMLYVAIYGVFMGDRPGRWKRSPRWLNWLSCLMFWAGIGWVIYHGHFAIPAMLTIASVLLWLVAQRKREAGIE